MASTHATIKVPMPAVRLSVQFPRGTALRIKAAMMILHLAAWVLPFKADLEVLAADGEATE